MVIRFQFLEYSCAHLEGKVVSASLQKFSACSFSLR
jgi:hypothetical protein